MSRPLVFLHGWGQSRQVWYRQMPAFPEAAFLNLPGHGGAAESDDWVATIVEQMPDESALLVGWSLGGMLAMRIALSFPERVAGLVLISTTPRFVGRNGWEHGSGDDLFQGFKQGLRENSARTMTRFFALMLHGDGLPRSEYNAMARAAVDKMRPPSKGALEQGLHDLATTDLIDMAATIDKPALVLHGSEDAIIPFAAGEWLAMKLPQAEFVRFEKCGHAPFLTQHEKFNTVLEAWCHRN